MITFMKPVMFTAFSVYLLRVITTTTIAVVVVYLYTIVVVNSAN